MRLLDFIYKLNYEASRLPNMGRICGGDIYELNHYQNIKYPAFCATQGQHSEAGDWRYYQFALFYVDRLTSTHKNAQEVQSDAIDALSRIIRNITSYGIDTEGSVTFDVFTERFDSECAGAYATVTFGTMVDDVCPEWYNGHGDKKIRTILYTTVDGEIVYMDNEYSEVGNNNLDPSIGTIIYQGKSAGKCYVTYIENEDFEERGVLSMNGINYKTIDLMDADTSGYTVAIYSENLSDVKFPDTISAIETIKDAKFNTVAIPSSVTYFGAVFDGCWNIGTATYKGTVDQFNAIEKDDAWSGNSSIQYIQCTDGRICLRDCDGGYTGKTLNPVNQLDCMEVTVRRQYVNSGLNGSDMYILSRDVGIPNYVDRATRISTDGKVVVVKETRNKENVIRNNNISRYPIFKIAMGENEEYFQLYNADNGLWLNVTSGACTFVSDISAATKLSLINIEEGFIGTMEGSAGSMEYNGAVSFDGNGIAKKLPADCPNPLFLYVLRNPCEEPYPGCDFETCDEDYCEDCFEDCFEDYCEDCFEDCPSHCEDAPCTDCISDCASDCSSDCGSDCPSHCDDAPCTDCQSDCSADAPVPQAYEMEKVTSIDGIDTGATYVLANDNVMAYRHNIDASVPSANNFYISGYTSVGGIVEDISDLAIITIPETGTSATSDWFKMVSGNYVLYTEASTDVSTDVTATVLKTTRSGNFGFGFYQDGRIFDLMWDAAIQLGYSLVDYSNAQWYSGLELVAQGDAQTYDALYLYKITPVL